MKKRILGIALVVAMLASLLIGGSVLAADPTEVIVTWEGSGWVELEVDTCDAEAGFETAGDGIKGSKSIFYKW